MELFSFLQVVVIQHCPAIPTAFNLMCYLSAFNRIALICAYISSTFIFWHSLSSWWWWWCGGVDPIPCVSTHRISDPRSGPAQLLPHTSSIAATPTGSVHKSQTVSVVGMSGQLKRCNESWFGSLQSGQFAAGWLAGSILCR